MESNKQSKKAISDDINKILNTEFDFSKMRRDDLIGFRDLAQSGKIIEVMAKGQIKKTADNVIDGMEWEPGMFLQGVGNYLRKRREHG